MPISLEPTNANSGLPVPVPPRRSTDTVRPPGSGNTAAQLTDTEQYELDTREFPEQVELLNTWLQRAVRIRDGAENLLSATSNTNGASAQPSRAKMIEAELTAAKDRIRLLRELREKLAESVKEKGLRRKLSHNTLSPPPTPTRRTHRPSDSTSKSKDITAENYRATVAQLQGLLSTLSNIHSGSATPSSSDPDLPITQSVPILLQLLNILVPPNKLTLEPTSPYPEPPDQQNNLSIRIRYELHAKLLNAIVPCLAYAALRPLAFVLLRSLLLSEQHVKDVMDPTHGLSHYLLRSLLKNPTSGAAARERESALVFIRGVIQVSSTANSKVLLTEGVVRTLVAIAREAGDLDDKSKDSSGTDGRDPMAGVVRLIVAEIAFIDPTFASQTGALALILDSLLAGPPELGPLLMSGMLMICDRHSGRICLGVGDLEIALTPLTAPYTFPNASNATAAIAASATLLTTMLRSWSGLLYLCVDEMRALKSVMNCLSSLVAREAVLDVFYSIFRIRGTAPGGGDETATLRNGYGSDRWGLNAKPKSPTRTEYDGDSMITDGETDADPGAEERDKEKEKKPKLNLIDQYLAFLLVILEEAGLFNALIDLLEELPSGSILAKKTTLLVSEILEVANRVLPVVAATRIQALPRLFSLATSFLSPSLRSVGSSTLSLIDAMNRDRSRLHHPPAAAADPQSETVSRARSNSSNLTLAVSSSLEGRTMDKMEQVKMKMQIGTGIDDRTFQMHLLESGVMGTKEWSKWNYDILLSLIEGPMLNPKRFEEAFRVSKFGKRIMTFFHPFSHRFCDMKNTKANQKWVKLGNSLLATLSSNAEGQRFLQEDQLLKQIVACFAQLDPSNGTPISDPIFGLYRISDTLSYGYFEMLGTMSKTLEGLELLEKFHIFTALYHISELKNREDLITLMIQNLDYSIDGHPRIVLSKALTSSYKDFRRYATEHLGQLIQSMPANTWTLQLLVTQLYDPSMEVCELAVQYLMEACESLEVLQLVVEMQPTLDHLEDLAHPLLLKFMSTAVGFRYLHGADYIEREMNAWFNERNTQYVVQVEVYLSKALNSLASEDDAEISEFDMTVPPHFYGEMARTDLGCQVLHDSKHVCEFADFIRQHGLEDEDSELILKLKSVLWAVGNIGANEGGLLFLEEQDIIPAIVNIAANSTVLSVRGTCFFALGLIASTEPGAEMLDDHGWETTTSPSGMPMGLSIPHDIRKYVIIPKWQQNSFPKPILLKESDSNMEMELEAAIYNLGNPVIQNSTSRGLQKLKQRSDTRFLFNSISVYYRALTAIATRPFRLSTRRFIMELFDFNLDAQLVKELNNVEKALTLDEDEPPPPPAEIDRRKSLKQNRFSTMAPRMNDDDSDVEVDVVGGVTGSSVRQPET